MSDTRCAFCGNLIHGRHALRDLQPCCVACWPYEGEPCAECERPLTRRESFLGNVCNRCWIRASRRVIERRQPHHVRRRFDGMTVGERAMVRKWAQALVCGRAYR